MAALCEGEYRLVTYHNSAAEEFAVFIVSSGVEANSPHCIASRGFDHSTMLLC